jgi:hypothetical protein
MRSRASLLIAIVAVLAVGVAGVQAAAGAKAKTKVKIDRVDPASGGLKAKYSGHVESQDEDCLKGRKIVLIHDSDPPFKIGEATTDKDGNWEITGNFPPDPEEDFLIVKVKKDEDCKGKKRGYRFYDLPGAPGPDES